MHAPYRPSLSAVGALMDPTYLHAAINHANARGDSSGPAKLPAFVFAVIVMMFAAPFFAPLVARFIAG